MHGMARVASMISVAAWVTDGAGLLAGASVRDLIVITGIGIAGATFGAGVAAREEDVTLLIRALDRALTPLIDPAPRSGPVVKPGSRH